MRGFAGNDTFQGDSRDGYFEVVTYSDAPSAVVVNLATRDRERRIRLGTW